MRKSQFRIAPDIARVLLGSAGEAVTVLQDLVIGGLPARRLGCGARQACIPEALFREGVILTRKDVR